VDGGGSAVAEKRGRARGQQGSEEVRTRPERCASIKVDAAVTAEKRSGGHQPGHLSAREPQRLQLLDPHHPVLAPTHSGQSTPAFHPILGAFLVLGTSNPPSVPLL
jgi:hypothetical protein